MCNVTRLWTSTCILREALFFHSHEFFSSQTRPCEEVGNKMTISSQGGGGGVVHILLAGTVRTKAERAFKVDEAPSYNPRLVQSYVH
jgi:hypothetical protein